MKTAKICVPHPLKNSKVAQSGSAEMAIDAILAMPASQLAKHKTFCSSFEKHQKNLFSKKYFFLKKRFSQKTQFQE